MDRTGVLRMVKRCAKNADNSKLICCHRTFHAVNGNCRQPALSVGVS